MKSVDIAILNMGNWLFYRQNKFLSEAHELAHQAINPANGGLLIHCVSAFEHAMLTLCFEYQPKERDKIETELKRVRDEIYAASDRFTVESRKKMSPKEYRELHRKVMHLFRMLYQAQYHVGMGVPKEKYKGVKLRLKEAMEA